MRAYVCMYVLAVEVVRVVRTQNDEAVQQHHGCQHSEKPLYHPHKRFVLSQPTF